MLSCRTLFRIDRVLGYTSFKCVKSTPESFRIMSFRGKAEKSSKNQTVNLVWRPMSTQSSSIVAEAGYEVQEAGQCSMSSTQGVVKDTTASVVSAGKHSVSLEVGASLIKFIRGKEGTTQMKIEEEMGVKIILPSSRNEDHIIIEGGSVDSVTKASERISTIVDEVVRSPSLDYSHFISLPLAIHSALVNKLVNFQNSVLGNHGMPVDEQDDQASRPTASVAVDLKANSETNQVNVDIKSIPIVSYQPKAKGTTSSTLFELGIEKSIFIKPNTFHLTVLMLKLWNKDRVNAARDVLKSISPSVMDALDNRPIFIRLKGLDCMRGPLAKARVLYVPVEEIGVEGRLLRACQVITDAFVKAGLVLEKDAKQSLNLHATVMNARHRKRKDKRKKMETFDAREIHKQFGNEDWGEYLIREAHLSQRFVFDQSGYYRCCASIPFPGEHRA
uniref:Activating signal cointegrator 1 complex subunit 1 n=1 Tax=Noccaea caerulescens TaxID=107243 RepID=A0A1J3JB40_NOCCA